MPNHDNRVTLKFVEALRLIDFRLSDGPSSVGICQGDIAGAARLANTVQRRLIFAREAGDTGWWGSWVKMAFNLSPSDPFITLPRNIARLINMTVCSKAISIQNSFFEMLEFGYGLQPRPGCCTSLNGSNCQFLEAYDRGTFPTFSDLVPGKKIRAYMTDASDSGKRVLIQGTDQNDAIIYGQDGSVPCLGEFMTLEPPFAQFPMTLNTLTGIQKDITTGPVKFYETDPITGNTRLILTMQPSEEVAAYRRYTVNGLPNNCCNNPLGTTQISAMAKLEFIPAVQDTDWLIIQNLEAMLLECEAVRFSKMDSPGSDTKAANKHRDAIGMLQGELTHYLGKSRPAVLFLPFGSARLERQGIGRMI